MIDIQGVLTLDKFRLTRMKCDKCKVVQSFDVHDIDFFNIKCEKCKSIEKVEIRDKKLEKLLKEKWYKIW